MKPKLAIITDIDGTLNQKNNPFNFDVNKCTYDYIHKLNNTHDVQTFYVTNRWKSLRIYTDPWLRKEKFPDTKNLHLEMNVDPGKERWNRIVDLCKKSGAEKCIFIDNNAKSRKYAISHQKEFEKKVGFPLLVLNPSQCPDFIEDKLD